MSKQEDFIKELSQLQPDLSFYLKKGNKNTEIYSKYYQLYQQVCTTVETTNSLGSAPSTKNAEDTCIITNVVLVKPSEKSDTRSTPMKTFSALLDVETSTDNCNLIQQDVKLIFSDSKTIQTKLKNIVQNDNVFQATVDIDFNGHINLTDGGTPNVKIQIGSIATNRIYYLPNSNIDLSSPNKAQKSVESFIWLSTHQYIDGKEAILAVCPKLTVTKNKYGDYILPAQFKKELPKNPHIINAEKRTLNLETMSIEDLDLLIKAYKKTLVVVQDISGNFEYNASILNDLEHYYNGSKGSSIFNQAYKKKVKINELVLANIVSKRKILSSYIEHLEETLIKKSIPKNLLDQAKDLLALIPKQETILEPLENQAEAYYNEKQTENSFAEWKTAIETIKQTCQTTQTNWDLLWKPFDEGVKDFETKNPQLSTNSHYVSWKESTYNNVDIYLESDGGIYQISEIDYYLKKFQAVIDKTGGDGKMEFVKGEDIISSAEEARFTAKPEGKKIKNNFSFEKVEKPLFDSTNGPEADDVKQGLVGDCYLLSALSSLTKDNQKAIKQMIIKKGNKYTVTLHENGIPVEVEVDEKLIVRKIANYKDSYPAAQPLDDIWVPIIEKAYAKLLGQTDKDKGGDLMKIESGSATEALKVLLGNKVSSPKEIYLDAAGLLVNENPSTTVTNPIMLSSIKLDILQQVIQAAHKAKYEINVSSPQKYKGHKGLNDHDIIPIGSNQYMSFKHAYSLLNATSSHVTIRNPHGNSNQEQDIFSNLIKTQVGVLLKAVVEIQTEFNANKNISGTSKGKMDVVIKMIQKNSLISGRFSEIIKDWGRIKEKKMVFEADKNVWIPKKSSAGFIKQLGKKVNQLQIDSIGVANQSNKRGKLQEGFLSKSISMQAEQTIPYTILKQYFHKVSIDIIN